MRPPLRTSALVQEGAAGSDGGVPVACVLTRQSAVDSGPRRVKNGGAGSIEGASVS